MQLQAERDHFVHSGIGGGSSSSSPSCSPPKDSPLSVIKVHNLKKPKAKTKDNEKEKGKEIKHGEEKVQETKHKEMRQETQKAVEVIEVKDLNMSMDMDVDMDTAKDAADTDVDMKNNKRKELKAGKAIFTVATEAATPVLSRDTRVTLDASYLLKQQFATSTPPSFTPSLAPLSAAAFSQLPSELFFNVLCLLDALDLTRLAQVNKFCARMVSDNGVWRVKSKQHPLFLERHIQGRRGVVPWLEYYKFLHRNSNIVKQNWADARPQAVHVLEGHTGLVSSLETSMWTLVTASIDSTLRVWDLRTLQCVRVLHAQQPLTCVSQSEIAGAACARTSFGGLYVWDIRTGELIMQDDTAMPQTASFMYMDECYIGYGQSDGAVTVFDWSSRTTLKVVGSYQAHEGDVGTFVTMLAILRSTVAIA
ncbi:WD40-repeat-containing domain protein [Gamsiella multidivaricata]|uniref:WD40-repeat-containing domain protein n=1 Tax=Gamsiella multidivaricata TaxID=101098 RepID=UPI00221E99F7|nr:WD40-repeat-containing domain protein [Gamsiella multidivaricata]KAI7818228.1 WD40-repeat-containing domain protein [Gamsiella multidivaricata]